MALVLGGFIFTDYAIPERVKLGGKHNFAVHKLIGGDRVVDAMGRDDASITWTGRFQGQDATAKAMALDQLRISGIQVPLVVDSRFYMVGVEDFEWDYERSYQIVYKISCLVVSTGGGVVSDFLGTLDQIVASDLTQVSNLVGVFSGGL